MMFAFSPCSRRSLLSVVLLVSAGLLPWGPVYAQQPNAPAIEALKAAAQAFQEGQEARAWDLYLPQAPAFRQHWTSLDSDFVIWVADQHRRHKEYKEAVAIADMVLAARRMNPEQTARLRLIKGDTYRDQQNYAAAKLEYESLDRDRDLRNTGAGKAARFRVVDILRLTRDFDGADMLIERLKDAPELAAQAEAYYLAARIAFDREDYAEARANLIEVKKRVPEHVEAVFLEAEINLREDRLQDPELEIGERVMTTYVVPGRPVTMRMQDPNLAVVRGGAGIPVDIRTLKGGDREKINLLPTPRDPTLFRGSISTVLGASVPGDMRLQVLGDDVVVYQIEEAFQKANNLNYGPKQMAVISDAELTATAGDFQSAEQRDEALLRQRMAILLQRDGKTMAAFERERDPWLVRPGNPIRIQVVDYDRSVSPTPDAVEVRAVASSGDVVERVRLTETGPNTGIFRGELPTAKSPPRASASDSASGRDPSAPLATGTAGWKSGPRGREAPWWEVDLMNVQPVISAEADLSGGGAVRELTLLGGAGDQLSPLVSTKPPREQVYGYVDLAAHFGSLRNTAAFLYTEIISEAAEEAVFKIGSCDGVTVWLNGQRIHSRPAGRIWKPEEDVVTATLQPGTNGVVLRVAQISGPWGASLTVLGKEGKPLSSMPEVPPAAPGVVLKWYLFNRPTPEENVEFGARVQTEKPVRIRDQIFRWKALDLTPAGYLVLEPQKASVRFARPVSVRKLRWVFDAFDGNEVALRTVFLRGPRGETILPIPPEAMKSTADGVLHLGPGDRIEITYVDERRIRRDNNRLTAILRSGFFNARAMFAYETIEMKPNGDREIVYDPAFRFRAGETDRLVVHVTDYDADVSGEHDKVPVWISTASGESLAMEAIETEPHSGIFVGILRLGQQTGGDTLAVTSGDTITLEYRDEESTDGQLLRTASVSDAPQDPPELILYQTLVVRDDEGLTGRKGPVVQIRPAPPGAGQSSQAPLVTSMDTSLHFKVLYPAAALGSKFTHVAWLTTEREAAAAEAQGGRPPYQEIPLTLTDPTNGEFSVFVDVRLGDPTAYVEEDSRDEALGRLETKKARFHMRSGDILRVVIPTVGKEPAARGWYTLATDASIRFMDRRYLEPERQIFVGDYVHLMVLDRDMDRTDDLDPIDVRLRVKAGEFPLTLTETLPHSGIFSGRMKTELAGSPAVEEGVLPVEYGETISAVYQDVVSVLATQPRAVTAQVQVFMGDDGRLATFTKRFANEDIAVKTRLLMAEALFELAKEHREGGQKAQAEAEIAEGKQVLEEAIADYPDTVHAPHAEFLLGNLAQELEKFEEALERYNKVLSNWPDSEFAPKAQLRKGICLERMGDNDNALDAYVELTYAYPRSPLVSDAILRLAQYFYRTKEFEVAGKIFGNFQTRNPEHPLAAKALFLSAQSYMKGAEERKTVLEGRYDTKAREWLAEAIAKFERLLGLYDDKDLRAEAMYWLGDCYLKVQDPRNAYIAFKRLTWDYPESKWAKFARGQLVQNDQAFRKFAMEN